MKRYLLFIISMLCVSIGTWATPVDFGTGKSTYEDNGDGSYTITVKKAEDLSTFGWDNWPWKNATRINLQLDGITMQSLCSVNELYNLTQNTSVTTIDFTNLNTTDLDYLKNNWGTVPDNFKPYFSNLIVPSSYASDFVTTTGKNVFAASSTTLNAYIANVNNVNWSDVKGSCTTLSLYNFSSGDLGSCGFSTIDFTNTTLTANTTVPSGATVYVNTAAEKNFISGTDASNVKVPFPGTATVAAGGSLESNITTLLNSYDLHNTLADITILTVTGELTSADVTWLNTNKSKLTGLTTLDLTGATFGAGVTKASVAAAVRTGVTVQYPASYTITGGCTVTIDMSKAMGDDLATILAAAKTALGSTNICTLIVTGEITNNDLIALGGTNTNMTGATRIDLSGATLGSGVTIDNIQLPATLEQLVLPKDQMFSVALKSKLTAATNLNYAYTPSSDCTATGPNQADESKTDTYKYDDSNNTIADYVWVNKEGGLAMALENEEQLRNSFYIKVASGVALTATDVNFNALTNKPTNYLFLDFSESIMTPAVADSYTVTDNIAYRIILPNNWSNADLAHFQSNGNKGNLAAVYSYEDTKLNILVIEDDSYWGTALQNPRIVRTGTNAIDILPGAYTNNHEFGTATTAGKGIITAINNADSSIKSVYISIANTGNNAGTTYTIANSNITYLSFEGIKSAYNGGPTVNVTGCSKLQTLNLKDAVLSGVIANGITSLTTVDMTGTTNSGATNLSGTGLKTFTTNSSTNFGGDLNLASTAITSFETQAKVTGDISLNACSSLAHIDVSGTQFQNTSSMIHVDESPTENSANKEAIGALTTIQVPTEFSSSSRIHPYDAVKDKIVEAATTGEFVLDDGCKIDYDATTGIATVTALHPGCLKQLMEKNNNYSKFPAGTIFTFNVGTTEVPVDCKLNAADLAALAGDATNKNYNKFYVDLYNLPASYTDGDNTYYYDDTKSGTTTTNGIISEAINTLRTNNWQYKGLLLPKTAKNIGTTLIQDRTDDETKVATCSQSIAYSGTIGTSALTAAYIYKAADDWGITHAERLGKMKEVMDLHPEIKNTTTNWSVSTNSPTPIDMSILPTSVTIEGNTVNTSKLETVNNDMVAGTGIPSIYAYPAYVNVMYTVATSTGIGKTPNLEILKVTGPVNATDIASINKFTDGPRVFDLSATTGGITKAMLESITNANIEYIILPEGMSKDVVCGAKYTTGLKTNLKAVISSSNTNLVAYVNKAGSLAEARYLATGGSINGTLFNPTPIGLQSVTLAGNLNASDIAANTTDHYLDENGHWTTTTGNLKSVALWGEQGTITTIDLKDAVFEEYTPTGGKLTSDMNFSYAGLASLHDIILPTSKSMTLIPAECFMGITTFNDLCIPYNYKKIDNAALLNAYCGHITTTDANGALIDNGEHSYTFSANLEEIGTKPATPDANGVYSLDRVVFPQNRGVTDVYVLAHQVPKCYANAFPANMLYGWGGFKGGTFPYCREKYDNSADGSMIFTVLHFPDEASFNASKDTGKESDYNIMKQKYTDVTKVYSMKEQTGAVDANGDAIFWPTFSELRRAYNQASDGIIWDDWVANYDSNHEVNGGDFIPTSTQPNASTPGEGNHSPLITVSTVGYNFTNYEGWHQFTLSQATYVEPDKIVENEKTINEYVKSDRWYTFCIPFSITADQIQEILGVPASTATVKSKVYDSDGTTVLEEESSGHNPEARTLTTVQRQPATTPGGVNNVTLHFSLPMVEDNSTDYYFWDIKDDDPNSSIRKPCGNTEKGKVIAMCGGLPYIVKPYLPKGVTVKNLGQYVMQRFGKMFTEDQACGNLGTDYYEQLGSRNKVTSRFVKPYEKHKIQAYKSDKESIKYYTHTDDGSKYYYAFVGQFWEQDLPQYSLYVVNGLWYRYASGNKGYKLAPYKCVVMAVPQDPDDTKDNSGKYRSDTRSSIPAVVKELTDDDVFENKPFYLGFLDGRDDESFEEGSASARETNYIFALDGDIIEYDENGDMVTGIDSLDGEDLKPAVTDGKIYNMTGQFVGTSIEGLSSGMYIMNGKKFVVK